MRDALDNFRTAIMAALGHAPDVIEPGKLQRSGTKEWPGRQRGDNASWCKLFADLNGGVFGDWRTGLSETWHAKRDAPMTRQQRAELARQIAQATAERERERRRQWAANGQHIARLWAQCVPLVPGDPVTLYLKRRGIGGAWPLPACLRLHRALPYWTDTGEKLGALPAMVAPLVAPDGRVVALHRTYLKADGCKASVPSVKKLTAASGPLAGACIPLHEPQRGVIGVAEGVETAQAAHLASGLPTVAAYCAGNLAAYQWPAGVRRIVVFADADPTGAAAAQGLKARALRAGLSVAVIAPSTSGIDWCDVWAQRGAVAVSASEAEA